MSCYAMSCYDTVATKRHFRCFYGLSARRVAVHTHIYPTRYMASVRQAATHLVDYHSSETSPDSPGTSYGSDDATRGLRGFPFSFFAGGSAEDSTEGHT